MGGVIAALLILSPAFAQESTPEPVPTFTETPTLTPSPTETATATPTSTEPPTWTPEATVEITPEVTAEMTATVTPVMSETPAATPSPTFFASPTPGGTQPELNLFYQDTFDSFDTFRWNFPDDWTATTLLDSRVLYSLRSAQPLAFVTQHGDLAVQISAAVLLGAVQFSVRDSGSDHYKIVLSDVGQVDFYRSGVLLQSTLLPEYQPLAPYTLQIYVVGGQLGVWINSQPMFAYDDPAPLGQGHIHITGGASSKVLIDDFALYIPTDQFGLYPQPPAADGVEEPYVMLGSPEANSLLATANTWILYSKAVNDEFLDLFALGPCAPSPCTPQQIRLTYTPTQNERSPSLSFDGTRLLFTRDGILHTMQLSGNFPVSALTYSDGSPIVGTGRFSPVNNQIVLARSVTSSNVDLFLLQPSGAVYTVARQLTTRNGYDYLPSWSPDGLFVTYTALEPGDIYTVRVSDGVRTNLTPDTDDAENLYAEWSNTGGSVNRIAFTSTRIGGDFELYTMQPNGLNVRQITFNLDGDMSGTRWSPDDNHLAFHNLDFSTGTQRLYIVDNVSSGTLAIRVLQSGSQSAAPDDWTTTFAVPPAPTPTPTMTPMPTPIPGSQLNIATIPLPTPNVPQGLISSTMTFLANGGNPNRVEIAPYFGVCDDTEDTREICSKYAYVSLYAFFSQYTSQSPVLWDLMYIVYQGELSDYPAHYGINSTQHEISLEALARSFFDSQGGACAFNLSNETFNCSFENVSRYLATVHSMYAQVSMDPQTGNAIVEMRDLFGLAEGQFQRLTLDMARGDFRTTTNSSNGAYRYEGSVQESTTANLDSWRTGQGPDVPSKWGNQVLATGATTYPFNASEHLAWLFVHVYPGGTAFNTPVPAGVTCTYISIITTNDGGLNPLSNC